MNGFTPYATGCPVIIADGLKGTDEVLVPVDPGQEKWSSTVQASHM